MEDQKITEHKIYNNEINQTVQCAKCSGVIGLRNGNLDGATGLAWFDPYVSGTKIFGHRGAYVHFECLSETRRDEIDEAYRLDKERAKAEVLQV